jgi:hypothetical protein
VTNYEKELLEHFPDFSRFATGMCAALIEEFCIKGTSGVLRCLHTWLPMYVSWHNAMREKEKP